MELVVFWVGVAIAVGILGARYRRSGFGWFFLAVIISPLLAGILLLAVGPRRANEPVAATPSPSDGKTCPMCAETVQRQALICRFCGFEFPPEPAKVAAPAEPARRGGLKNYQLVGIAAVALAAVGVAAILVEKPAVAEKSWHLTATQASINFVTVDHDKIIDKDVYRRAITDICGRKTVCQILFWSTNDGAPTALPMSDEQAAMQVAHWQFNESTNLRRLLWSCGVFPTTPTDQCF